MNKKIFNILFEQENVDSPEQSMKLANTDFKDFIKKQYSIGHTAPVEMEEIADELSA